MRIRSIFVDGFGIWHESRLEPDAGLTVVRGDNEAGKTTLLAFIRAMLFGFETNQYPAVAGGRRGGWLDVVTADERHFRIERYGDRGGQGAVHVTGDDGVDRGPEYLSRLLHGVEASVYRNVFAFRLEELSELKGLTEGGVAARIYGAGLGTGAASALAVETGLRGEVAGLFKPGGSNPRINQLLKEIEEVERTLSGLDLPADYAAARTSLADLETEQERLAASIESLGSERRRLDRIVAGWQPTQELRAAEAALAAEPEPGAVPAGALERFTRLEAASRASQERLDDAAARVAGRRERLAELHPDEALLARRTEVESLVEAHASVRGEAGALREAEAHLASAERQLDDTLAQLGEGWTEERVAALDLSVATKSALGGRFRDLLDGAARGVDRHEIALGTAEAAVAEAIVERDGLDRRLNADARPAAEPATPTSLSPRRLSFAVGGLSLLVAAVLALTGAPASGAAAAVVGLLVAAATWLLTTRRSVSGEPPAARRAAVEERRAMASDRLQQASRVRDTARAALDAATGAQDRAAIEWREWLSAHGFDPELDRETVLSLFEAATSARATIRRRDEASETVSRLAARRDAVGEQATALLATLARPAKASVPAAVDALGAELRASVMVQEEAARIERELREVAADHEKAAGRREQDAAGLAALLEECGVTSEAELRENVARQESRRALEEDASRARQSLAILSGRGDAADRLATEIEAVDDIGQVRDRLAVIRTELDAMAAARDLVLREMGALQGQIETLEASVEMSAARQRHADLVSRLEAEAEDWSVRRLAVGLMERTRQRYEREHRPGVIKTAEAFLADWTDGRWVRIVAPLGGAIDGLERVDGKQVAIGALSRGTQEQLYLALRFGLIEHFADEAEPLPIVMDETLVNFDEARAERTARTIEQLSARHQILYFTCRDSSPLRSPSIVRLQPPTLAGAVGADLPPAVERVTA